MRAVIAWGLVALVMFALFPVVYGRENKCTSAETAFMIAKRFTVGRESLSIDDQPDFPWETPDVVQYQGSCMHRVTSWFDRVRDGQKHRIAYAATVQYDPVFNAWSLVDWTQTGDVVIR
jgi:hypothetical protein